VKRRNYKHYIRKSHRWLGVFLGVQFFLWTAGGLFFSWTQIEEIRGETLRRESEPVIKTSQLLTPAAALAEAGIASTSIRKFELINVDGAPFYQVDQSNETLIIDARTGIRRSPLSEDDARRVALAAVTISEPIRRVALLSSSGDVSAHHEYREKPLPAFAVEFSSGETVYVSALTGKVTAVRTAKWRVFDFLWMLHTMDFAGRDNINNWLLRLFSLLGLITIGSGFLLFMVSSRKLRRNRSMTK
jgi:uncharacterized iron-regulated membrane protein